MKEQPKRRCAVDIPQDKIAEFCRRNHIRKLSLFGSVLRSDFGPESDVDVLVEFKPGHPVGLIRLMRIQRELSNVLGRKADLNTKGFLHKRFRDEILKDAEVQYAEAG